MWDTKAPQDITYARLLRMPPERVYDELKDYGAYLAENSWGCNTDLEQALYDRSNELINLGLAQFGANTHVASELYQQSLADTSDPTYSRAIRIALLGNPGLAHACQFTRYAALVDGDELLRLAATAGTGNHAELVALLQNPGARWLLSRLFNREEPFDQVAPKHFHWMLMSASYNHCINQDDGDKPWSDSPDLVAYGIQKGIWKLVQSLPVSEGAIESLYMLLDRIEIRRAHIPDEDPTAAIKRWRSVALSKSFKSEHYEYRYTTLDYAEEFCCFAAAIYGQWFDRNGKDTKIVYIGDADSPDLVLRCAYYARIGNSSLYGAAPLTADQIERAYKRDGDAFILAALCNPPLIRSPTTRTVFENSGMLGYGSLRELSARRYKEVLGLVAPEEQDEGQVTPHQAIMAKIESELASLTASLGQRLTTESVKSWWMLALLALLLVGLWSRGF